jgi:hypothetical protein
VRKLAGPWWENVLANLEFISDCLYFSAYATLPVFALLVVLWQHSPSPTQRAAYTRTTVSSLLATLSCAVVFAGFLHVITYLVDDIDTGAPEPGADIH